MFGEIIHECNDPKAINSSVGQSTAIWLVRSIDDYHVLVDFYQYLVGGVSEDDLRKNKDVVGWINVKDGKS